MIPHPVSWGQAILIERLAPVAALLLLSVEGFLFKVIGKPGCR